MMRVAIAVVFVSLVAGVRLDDDVAQDPVTTAAATTTATTTATTAATTTLATKSAPAATTTAAQAAAVDKASQSNSAISSFANLMKDRTPEGPKSMLSPPGPASEEDQYPNCIGLEKDRTPPRTPTNPMSLPDVMDELESAVDRELDRPAVGLASDVGSEAGRMAISAGYAPEKVACVAAKMVLAVGGSNAESKQTGDLAQTEAQTASQIDAKAEEMVVTKVLNIADKLNAAAEVAAPETMRAATMVTKAGASSDSEAESQQIADDFKKAKDASMQVSFSSPVAASSIPSTHVVGEIEKASSSISSSADAAAIIAEASQQAESTRASSSSAAYSLSEAGAKDKKKSSTAEAFDAIKKLADSLLPGAKATNK